MLNILTIALMKYAVFACAQEANESSTGNYILHHVNLPAATPPCSQLRLREPRAGMVGRLSYRLILQVQRWTTTSPSWSSSSVSLPDFNCRCISL